ncbi:hypothetical protein AB832_06180 [Flavobacteriaceae bacterium (ex Bugula neritina AB1)]|nr:hypothetical protein AB832_06180 [Flavobacteriaceae bacterium (ex Bugula neritina AB1)]
MKQEQQLLYRIMSHFDGMQKIEVFDLLHKMETLLFYAKSPLRSDHLKKIIASDIDPQKDIDPFQFTILSNGNFCELIGHNDWIHIYKEVKRGLGRWYPYTTYYFKTKYAPLELLKLNKKNLMEQLHNTTIEVTVANFLSKYPISKKDPITNTLLLLEL